MDRQGHTDVETVVQLFDFCPEPGQIILWYGTVPQGFQILFDRFYSPHVFRYLRMIFQ